MYRFFSYKFQKGADERLYVSTLSCRFSKKVKFLIWIEQKERIAVEMTYLSAKRVIELIKHFERVTYSY